MEKSNEGDLREALERLGYKLMYVLPEVMEDHIACFRVEYEWKLVYPPAVDGLGSLLDEIRLSGAFKPNINPPHRAARAHPAGKGLWDPRTHWMAERDEENALSVTPDGRN
jgi:hypothetical protein